MKFFPALLIGVKLNWCLGRLNRIERRPARQIQEYVADSSAADEAADGYRFADVNVGILSDKEGRRLQEAPTSCALEDIVDCVEGYSTSYVNVTNPRTGIITKIYPSCEAACEDACCVGDDACLNFTGSVCKDMTSCSGFGACKNAKITSVFNSCNGVKACEEAGEEGYVGNVTNSCNDRRSCRRAGGNGGSVGVISSSCSKDYSCYFAGYQGYVGIVTDSCNSSLSCYGAAKEGYIREISSSCNGEFDCKYAASYAGNISSITNSCTSTDGSCQNAAAFGGYIGFIKDSCNNATACQSLAAEPQRRKLEEEVDFKDATDSWREAKAVCLEPKLNDCWKDWCKENDSLCGVWCASSKKANTTRCSDGFLEDTWASVKDDCQERKATCFEQWCTDNPFKCDEWCSKERNISKSRCTNRITGPIMSSPPSRSPTSAPTSSPTPLSCVNECCNAASLCKDISLANLTSQDDTCQPCEGSELFN